MLRAVLTLFGVYIPPEFLQILDAVKENDITRLVVDSELIEKFGGWYERDHVAPRYFERLAKALEDNTSVRTLEIKGYMIPSTISYQLVNALRKNKTVNSVILNNSSDHSEKELLADILHANTTIKHVFIGCCCIGDARCVQKIAESLAVNRTLRVLELNRPHVLSNEASDAVSRIPLINKSLEKIVLYTYERLMQPGDKPWKEFDLDTPRKVDLLRDKSRENNTLFKFMPRDVSEELIKYLGLPQINREIPDISRLR